MKKIKRITGILFCLLLLSTAGAFASIDGESDLEIGVMDVKEKVIVERQIENLIDDYFNVRENTLKGGNT